jgi:hypothetical protein
VIQNVYVLITSPTTEFSMGGYTCITFLYILFTSQHNRAVIQKLSEAIWAACADNYVPLSSPRRQMQIDDL